MIIDLRANLRSWLWSTPITFLLGWVLFRDHAFHRVSIAALAGFGIGVWVMWGLILYATWYQMDRDRMIDESYGDEYADDEDEEQT